jgi:hypothetical protein
MDIRCDVLNHGVFIVARTEPAPSSRIESLQVCSRCVPWRMHREQRITIDLAVQILRSTLDQTSQGRVDTMQVRLALRCLWAHCPERWPLVMFWEGAQQENEIGRSQSVTASFNGIVRQLRRSGVYSDTAP